MQKMAKALSGLCFIFLIIGLSIGAFGQSRTRRPAAKKPVTAQKKTPTPTPSPQAENNKTENDLPAEIAPIDTAVKTNKRGEKKSAADVPKGPPPTHFYTFTQPEFVVSSISIEHDDAGKGKITFTKRDWDDSITEPLQVSSGALERISAALTALDFFNSNENYQYEKDYSHLGNVKILIKKNDKERSVAFNWTANKDAKTLADEYRRIANQAIWVFDITVARENQPLETPQMMDTLDSYIRRNEISDAEQMLSFLQKLSNDERLPLIARNHAGRLSKELEKQIAKKDNSK